MATQRTDTAVPAAETLDLEPHVVPLGAGQWRICTGEDPASPGFRLSYVEKRSRGYDVLIVAPAPPQALHVDTFDEAARTTLESSR